MSSDDGRLVIKRWKMAGFRAVRRAQKVQELVDETAAQVAAECGGGFEAHGMQGRTRYRAMVYPARGAAFRQYRRGVMHEVAARWRMRPGNNKKRKRS